MWDATFDRSRDVFRSLIDGMGGSVTSLSHEQLASGVSHHTVPSIDLGVIGDLKAPNILMHISGTHGIEAPVGAAIQRSIFHEISASIPRELEQGVALVFVHCLNPWGMMRLRRVNAENIDLNRNSPPQREGQPELRPRLRYLLDPDSEPSASSFMIKAVLAIAAHGYAGVKEAIVGGQYVEPRSLYYGGAEQAIELKLMGDWVSNQLGDAKRLAVIDLHSGLGRYMSDSLIVGSGENREEYALIEHLFGEEGRERIEVEDEISFRTSGGLEHLIRQSLPQARVLFATHELGTYNPIRVLHALVRENYLYHQKPETSVEERGTELRDVFCPRDGTWRAWALKRGRAVFSAALRGLANL
jgi:hypothetical protein